LILHCFRSDLTGSLRLPAHASRYDADLSPSCFIREFAIFDVSVKHLEEARRHQTKEIHGAPFKYIRGAAYSISRFAGKPNKPYRSLA
jgi:hypothetical protein